MPWSSSTRKDSLPPDWQQRRALCMARANGRCEARTDTRYQWEWPDPSWIGPDNRCIRTATDVDHRSSRDNHDDLQALCSGPFGHHTQKTQRESAAGRAAVRKKLAQPVERPPGLR